MPNLNRRDFLKALGVSGGASALSACGWDTNRYTTPVENVLPYVVKPEQVTPGTPTFFATTVTRGPSALPVLARHRDGRVVFISANTRAPTGPAVPTSALFEMQRTYSPDRITGPRDGGEDTTWEAGLEKLVAAVKGARAAGKSVAYLGGYKSGAIVDLLQDFTGGQAYFWEPAGYETEAIAAEKLFGKRVLPHYAYDKADYVLSFGAPFLAGWGDADSPDLFAKARNPNIDHSVARFALVSPHRDLTGAKADDWLACTPGSELLVARAIAKLVADKKGASAQVKALIGSVSVADAAAASGLSAEALETIATRFADGHGLALPGGVTGTADLAAATYLLNVAADPSGERFHLGGYAGPISGYTELEGLIAAMKSGSVGVLIVDDANPVYALPSDSGFAEAVASVGTVVSVSSEPSETTALATLVLPSSGVLEDWGDEAPRAGLRLMRQPAMSALYDTRSLGDILLAVGRAAGLGETEAASDDEEASAPSTLGMTPETWRDYVAAFWKSNVFSGGDFASFWESAVIDGFATVAVSAASVAPVLTASSYAFGAVAPAGDGDVYVHVHTHPLRQDGRYANQPWAQEVPDPMTGIVWDSWIEVGEEHAQKLGLKTNDLVELTTAAGSVSVGVQVTRGLQGETIALALGQGHEKSGRYADGYGVNAASLFSTRKDSQGALAWGPVKASLKSQNKRAGLVSTFSQFGTSDEGRSFGVAVSAEKLAKVGDSPVDHPGELTGIHHLQLDSRLTDRGITDFYGLPDHPTYRFGMTVDTNACTGCGACSVACYAENNLPVVGKAKIAEGREMGWIRINRYWETDPDLCGEQDDIRFTPMMCQQCGHAGCENVCPVLATYHNIDGLNAMVYNRCVGTRYCSNACPFSARRFNYHTYSWPEPFNLMLNPDVSTRSMGVMEKCTFCVQRLRRVKSAYKDGGNFTAVVPSEVWEQVPACAEACPSQAMTFGNLNDENSKIVQSRKSARTYEPLGELNVFSAVNYLAKANFHHDPSAHHGSGEHHDGGHDEHAATGHGDDHGAKGHDDKHAEPAKGADHGHEKQDGHDGDGHEAGSH